MRLGTRGLVLLVAVGIAPAPVCVEAQQVGNVRRIGYLAEASSSPASVDAFRQALADKGYVEGRNLLVERRSGQGKTERLAELATELARLGVEVLVTEGPASARAAKNATASIPIVFTFAVDPVALGLVASLARPGGNTTGVANVTVELTGKRLELLREAIPSLKSVALLTNPANPASALGVKEAQIAARRLGLDVRLVEVRGPSELEPALSSVAHEHATAVALVPGAWLFMHRQRIAEIALKRRLPVMGWHSQLAESGALISYGPDWVELFRRAASHVDKILKGAKPADLPVEQPTKVELIVNLKTAKALGLTIPPSVRLRADRVLE
jgi:putative tryptophan/tyrosine transport system substrate-binding protein